MSMIDGKFIVVTKVVKWTKQFINQGENNHIKNQILEYVTIILKTNTSICWSTLIPSSENYAIIWCSKSHQNCCQQKWDRWCMHFHEFFCVMIRFCGFEHRFPTEFELSHFQQNFVWFTPSSASYELINHMPYPNIDFEVYHQNTFHRREQSQTRTMYTHCCAGTRASGIQMNQHHHQHHCVFDVTR
jgi:hypothetical protein